MNRREFLLSLLSVPFGWKALFRKEVEELPVEDSMQEEEPLYWHWVPGIPLEPETPGTFAGLDRVTGTGWEVGEWQVVEDMDGCECPECSGGLLLPDWVADELKSGKASREWVVDVPLDFPLPEMDGIRVDGIDAVTGPISNLRDWGKESQFVYTNPSYGADWVPGQWMWAEDICRILTEIIERDVPGMLLQGSYDIDWMPPEVYIRQDCGPSFWCKDVDAEKTVWYRKAPELSHYGETWELIT